MGASRCRSCGAHVIWAKTQSGKNIPVDLQEIVGGNLRILDVPSGKFAKVIQAKPDVKAYRTHFASCPNADGHRRNR